MSTLRTFSIAFCKMALLFSPHNAYESKQSDWGVNIADFLKLINLNLMYALFRSIFVKHFIPANECNIFSVFAMDGIKSQQILWFTPIL